ncbi:MAG: hypothetical protein U5L02_19335 [Rheinheimera sp.]|nr:hypothetical protein [Rheinheimera sp.]
MQDNNPEWKTMALNEVNGEPELSPNGAIGYRWGEPSAKEGKW